MRAWIGTGQRACVCAWVCARHTIIRHLVVVCAQRHTGVVWSPFKKRVEFPVRSSRKPREILGTFRTGVPASQTHDPEKHHGVTARDRYCGTPISDWDSFCNLCTYVNHDFGP